MRHVSHFKFLSQLRHIRSTYVKIAREFELAVFISSRKHWYWNIKWEKERITTSNDNIQSYISHKILWAVKSIIMNIENVVRSEFDSIHIDYTIVRFICSGKMKPMVFILYICLLFQFSSRSFFCWMAIQWAERGDPCIYHSQLQRIYKHSDDMCAYHK